MASSVKHTSRVKRLYKLIFRVHRALPSDLKVLGDNYARDEFKRHKDCSPSEAQTFLKEWTEYAIHLARQMKPLRQMKNNKVGEYLNPEILDDMSEQQLMQLYELHKAATSETIQEDLDFKIDK